MIFFLFTSFASVVLLLFVYYDGNLIANCGVEKENDDVRQWESEKNIQFMMMMRNGEEEEESEIRVED